MRFARLASTAVEQEVRYGRFLGDWLAARGEARSPLLGAHVRTRHIATIAALAMLGASALALGLLVGGGRAAGEPAAATSPMPICDPGACYGPTTTATTATTTTTATEPPPGGGGGTTQCSDGRDNDANGLADYPDDFQGCSSPGDVSESGDDYPSSSFGVDETYEVGYQDDAGYTDSAGANSCAYAGGRRYAKDRILHKDVWSFGIITHWCWNGSRVTQASGPQIIVDKWGFPYNVPYPIGYRLLDEQNAISGGSSAQAYAQGEFQMCARGTPICQTWHPWIRIVMYANGQVSCHSDQGAITGCRGNGP